MDYQDSSLLHTPAPQPPFSGAPGHAGPQANLFSDPIPIPAPAAPPGPQMEAAAADSILLQALRETNASIAALLSSVSTLTERMAALESGFAALQQSVPGPHEGLTAEQGEELMRSMSRLRADNLSVLRETVDFRRTAAQNWGDELDRYRALFRNTVYDDLLREMAAIYCQTLALIERTEDPGQQDKMRFTIIEPMEDLFKAFAVELRRSEPGQKRSFRTTNSARQETTGQEELNGVVIRSISPAFIRGATCLVREEVMSYLYKAPAPAAEPAAGAQVAPTPPPEDASPPVSAPEQEADNAVQPVPVADDPAPPASDPLTD